MDEFTTVSGHQPLVSKWAQASKSPVQTQSTSNKSGKCTSPANTVRSAATPPDPAIDKAAPKNRDENHRGKLESKWARPVSQPKNHDKHTRSANASPKPAPEPKVHDIGAGLRACMHNRPAAPPQKPRRSSRKSSDTQSKSPLKSARNSASSSAGRGVSQPPVPLPAATDFSAWEDLYDPDQSWADAELDYVP